jgi:hypothetical protein
LREKEEAVKLQWAAVRNTFFKQVEHDHPPFSPPQDSVTIMHLPGQYPKRFASHAYSEALIG